MRTSQSLTLVSSLSLSHADLKRIPRIILVNAEVVPAGVKEHSLVNDDENSKPTAEAVFSKESKSEITFKKGSKFPDFSFSIQVRSLTYHVSP